MSKISDKIYQKIQLNKIIKTFSLIGISKILIREKFLAKMHIEEKMNYFQIKNFSKE